MEAINLSLTECISRNNFDLLKKYIYFSLAILVGFELFKDLEL